MSRGDVRTWQDYRKPGEIAPGGLWCAARSVGGHVVQITTGHHSEAEALAALGGGA